MTDALPRQREWLVYDNETYYPSAEIIQAETAAEAVAIVRQGLRGDSLMIAVPFVEADAYLDGGWDGELQQLRDEGTEHRERMESNRD